MTESKERGEKEKKRGNIYTKRHRERREKKREKDTDTEEEKEKKVEKGARGGGQVRE